MKWFKQWKLNKLLVEEVVLTADVRYRESIMNGNYSKYVDDKNDFTVITSMMQAELAGIRYQIKKIRGQ